jgi:hypothetical protein
VPFGANTVPVTVVFEFAAQVLSTFVQKPVHAGPEVLHTFGLVAPHVPPPGQVAPHCTVPPQPSEMKPQLKPSVAQSATVFGTQAEVPPHTLGVPPPPHVWGGTQVLPQSI